MTFKFSVMQMMLDLEYFKEGSVFLDCIKIIIIKDHIRNYHYYEFVKYYDKYCNKKNNYADVNFDTDEYRIICPDISKCRRILKYKISDVKKIMKLATGFPQSYWEENMDADSCAVILNYANKIIKLKE